LAGRSANANDMGPVCVMKAPSRPRFSELQLVLEPAARELVRAFVREASLAEGVPVSVASLIADDTAQAWPALCSPESDHDRARIALLCSHRDVRTRILLHGHSRFSPVSPVTSTESTDGKSAFTAA